MATPIRTQAADTIDDTPDNDTAPGGADALNAERARIRGVLDDVLARWGKHLAPWTAGHGYHLRDRLEAEFVGPLRALHASLGDEGEARPA